MLFVNMSFWKSLAEFSGMRLSSVLINAADKFEGLKLCQGKNSNLDTKNLALFQNFKLLLLLIC